MAKRRAGVSANSRQFPLPSSDLGLGMAIANAPAKQERANMKLEGLGLGIGMVAVVLGACALPSPEQVDTVDTIDGNEQALTAGSRFSSGSVRLNVGTGSNIGIVGFTIGATGNASLVVRALGPTLSGYGLTGVLANPTLTLFNGAGVAIATNDNWLTDVNHGTVQSLGLAPPNSLEPAIYRNLAPGIYTVHVSGVSSGTGLSLIEVYDTTTGTTNRLVNFSARGQVQTGNNVMIGGFTITGGSGGQFLVRGLGPSLPDSLGAFRLGNPYLELKTSTGTLLTSNNEWQTTQGQAIYNTGLSPAFYSESAILTTRAAGTYTAVLSGSAGQTGLGMLELWDSTKFSAPKATSCSAGAETDKYCRGLTAYSTVTSQSGRCVCTPTDDGYPNHIGDCDCIY